MRSLNSDLSISHIEIVSKVAFGISGQLFLTAAGNSTDMY